MSMRAVVNETLRAGQKDGKRIYRHFIMTTGKSLEDLLSPVKYVILSATTRHGFSQTAMVELL